jgi:hypothetical protein
MRISQAAAGAAVTTSASFAVDRFRLGFSMDGACSVQQDTSAPAGFVNSIKFTTTTADTNLGASQSVIVQQRIEGTNVADLGWGAAGAQPVTLSFWARSSLTGTFGGSIQNSASNRSYPFTYSISAADTWEQKTITVAGDTSGTWLTTTGIGMRVTFSMGAGSSLAGTAGAWSGSDLITATGAVSVIGTLNATWFVTGVQLEAGSVATPFERRDYGRELIMCQRYHQQSGVFAPRGYIGGSAVFHFPIPYAVTMRAAATVTIINFTNVANTSGVVPVSSTANGITFRSTAAANAEFEYAAGYSATAEL